MYIVLLFMGTHLVVWMHDRFGRQEKNEYFFERSDDTEQSRLPYSLIWNCIRLRV